MKNLYQDEAVQEIIRRLQALKPDNQKQWGKMDIAQMLSHCTEALKMASGVNKPKRAFLGRVLGRFFKPMYHNEKPLDKGGPTATELIITGERDFNKEKEQLIADIKKFNAGGPEKCTTHPHSFFGKLTPEEWGIGMYKHLDHHLRQFSA